MELRPGDAATRVEVGGEVLLRLGHEMCGRLGSTPDRELVLARDLGAAQRVVDVQRPDPAREPDLELAHGDLVADELAEPRLRRLVAAVRGHERVQVGEEHLHPLEHRVQPLERLSERLRRRRRSVPRSASISRASKKAANSWVCRTTSSTASAYSGLPTPGKTPLTSQRGNAVGVAVALTGGVSLPEPGAGRDPTAQGYTGRPRGCARAAKGNGL